MSHELAIKPLVRHSYLKVQLGLVDLLLRWLSHTAGESALAVARWPQLFAMCLSPQGYLSVLTTWPLAFPIVKKNKNNLDWGVI